MRHKSVLKFSMASPFAHFFCRPSSREPRRSAPEMTMSTGWRTWSTSLHEPDLGVPGLANAGFNNQTLRQIVHTSVGGHQVRVRFSTYGAGGLVVGAAHIALHAGGGAIMPGSDRTTDLRRKSVDHDPRRCAGGKRCR